MSFGIKTMDSAGNILFDSTVRLIRVLHVEFVGLDDPVRSVPIPGLRADRAWWISSANISYRRGPVAGVFDGFIQVVGGRSLVQISADYDRPATHIRHFALYDSGTASVNPGAGSRIYIQPMLCDAD